MSKGVIIAIGKASLIKWAISHITNVCGWCKWAFVCKQMTVWWSALLTLDDNIYILINIYPMPDCISIVSSVLKILVPIWRHQVHSND